MADLLSSLASRAVGQHDSIRPRVVSAYERQEPEVESGWSELLDVADPAEPPARPAVELSAPRVAGEPLSPRDATATRDDHTAVNLPPTPAARQREAAPARPGVMGSPSGDDRIAAAARPVPARVEPLPGPRPARAVAPAQAGQARRPIPASAGAESPEPRPPFVRISATDRPESSERPSPIVPDDPARDAARHTAEPGVTVRLLGRVAADDAPRPMPRAPREPSSPPVTVSIGRVEVQVQRAAEPSRPAPRSAPPQPDLSLAEYLARSRRGRT